MQREKSDTQTNQKNRLVAASLWKMWNSQHHNSMIPQKEDQ